MSFWFQLRASFIDFAWVQSPLRKTSALTSSISKALIDTIATATGIFQGSTLSLLSYKQDRTFYVCWCVKAILHWCRKTKLSTCCIRNIKYNTTQLQLQLQFNQKSQCPSLLLIWRFLPLDEWILDMILFTQFIKGKSCFKCEENQSVHPHYDLDTWLLFVTDISVLQLNIVAGIK